MNELYDPKQQQAISAAADHVAANHAFEDYRQRKSFQTKRRQDADLRLFESFLQSVGMVVQNLNNEPLAWANISWGLVRTFVEWQLQQGYAISSINVHLSTIKRYATLAFQTGTISVENNALIQTVKSYGYSEGIHVDEGRDQTRVGKKKSESVVISYAKAQILKSKHNGSTGQGLRDQLLMNLLLGHGMRIGEVHLLTVNCFDLEAGLVCFYRPKVHKTSTHELAPDCYAALIAYRDSGDMPNDPTAPLLRASVKGGRLTFEGVTTNRLSDRVREIGQANDIDGLSAHDCRHYWATRTAAICKDPFQLQEAGGWSSLAMPRRYIKMAEIANKGLTDI